MSVRGGIALVGVVVFGLVAGGAPAAAAEQPSFEQYVKFEQSIAKDIDGYWKRISAKRKVEYRSARLMPAGPNQVVQSACGELAGDPATSEAAIPIFYCVLDETIYLSSVWAYRDLYLKFGDFGPAAAIAHEWAHQAQTVSGTTNLATKQKELQADCWAGAWVRDANKRGVATEADAKEAGTTLYAAGDYEVNAADHHGTPDERLKWFGNGYRTGDPGKCNP